MNRDRAPTDSTCQATWIAESTTIFETNDRPSTFEKADEMLLSVANRFLFIHIPKTGGISVRKALTPFGTQPRRYLAVRCLSKLGVEFNHWGPLEMRRFRTHTSAKQSRRLLPRTLSDQLFCFAFVRNPWDRMVSYYHYVLARRDHRRHKQVNLLSSFENYVDYEIERGKLSQTEMLVDDHGKLLVDFVGRYETLHEDFCYLCKRLGIVGTLGHHNRSNHRDYRTYYNSRTVERVAEHFCKDIELFGYSFDGPATSQPMQLAA